MTETMRVEIYQIQKSESLHDFAFRSYASLTKAGKKVDAKNYQLMYRCDRKAGAHLESIYQEFNLDRPEDFHGHSLSMGDVIVTVSDGVRKAFYVDTFGFREVPEFDADDAYIPTPDEGAQG